MSIRLGDTITGRDVTMGNQVTGTVIQILYPTGLGYYSPTPNDREPHNRRYRIARVGSPTVRPEAIVECAGLTA